jgi:hypothetical protein
MILKFSMQIPFIFPFCVDVITKHYLFGLFSETYYMFVILFISFYPTSLNLTGYA